MTFQNLIEGALWATAGWLKSRVCPIMRVGHYDVHASLNDIDIWWSCPLSLMCDCQIVWLPDRVPSPDDGDVGRDDEEHDDDNDDDHDDHDTGNDGL